jgi:hypothetical protein
MFFGNINKSYWKFSPYTEKKNFLFWIKISFGKLIQKCQHGFKKTSFIL